VLPAHVDEFLNETVHIIRQDRHAMRGQSLAQDCWRSHTLATQGKENQREEAHLRRPRGWKPASPCASRFAPFSTSRLSPRPVRQASPQESQAKKAPVPKMVDMGTHTAHASKDLLGRRSAHIAGTNPRRDTALTTKDWELSDG
jgi:hypothetical protein